MGEELYVFSLSLRETFTENWAGYSVKHFKMLFDTIKIITAVEENK